MSRALSAIHTVGGRKKENPPPDTGNSDGNLHAKRDIAENILAEQKERQEVTNCVKQSNSDGADGCRSGAEIDTERGICCDLQAGGGT